MEILNGLLITFFLGVFILIGGLITFITKHNTKIIDFSIGMAFGVMIMLFIFDLIPETSELFEELFKYHYILLIIGLLFGTGLLKIFDIFIPDHHDENKENNEHIGIVSTLALVLHNIIEGMAIYSVFTTDNKTAFLLALGIGLHNIPLGMIITTLLYRNNYIKKSVFSMILLSLSTFIGGIIVVLLKPFITDFVLAILLVITSGMILYITLFELLPRIIENKNKKYNMIGIIFGVLLIGISLLL